MHENRDHAVSECMDLAPLTIFWNDMIKQSFIKKQIAKANRTGATPRLLRGLVLTVVDQVANRHYGDQYPMKCLQTSAAVRRLLDVIGIRSTLWCGAVCFAEVFESGSDFAWGGFWDRDHHVWLVTEFGEYVDLNISQMHKHPGSRRNDGIPVPAVWWDDITRWPSVITYLPDSPIGIGLEGSEAVDLARFLDLVQQAFHDLVTQSEVHAVNFGPLLTGPDGLNDLHVKGLPWAVRAYEFEVRNVHRPSWIVDRQAELEAASSTRTFAGSRLDDVLR